MSARRLWAPVRIMGIDKGGPVSSGGLGVLAACGDGPSVSWFPSYLVCLPSSKQQVISV